MDKLQTADLKKNLLISVRKSINIDQKYKNKVAASDLFEAYIFSIIIDAAKEEGAQVIWEDIDGKQASNVIFRRSPGYINSRADKYTHAILDFQDQKIQLEVHLGIYTLGNSNVIHECDVAVIKREEALRCRAVNNGCVPIKSTAIVIGIECKCYENSRITLGLGRSFIGLIKDLHRKNKYFFVFNTTQTSVEKLLSYHHTNWAHNITPKSIREVAKLKASFQTAFQYYKAICQ